MKTRRRIAFSGIILGLFLLDLAGFIFLGFKLNQTPQILEPPVSSVENDREPPKIALNGDKELTLLAGEKYKEPGASASDNADPVKLEISGEVDTNTPGTYYVKYQAVDFSGNFTIKKRKVTVIKKKGTIFLTFDDGPGEYTEKLLDVLKKYDVKATFFVTGKGDDSIILREFKEGHAIGSHTFSHDYSYIYQNPDNFMRDLEKVKTRIYDLTGYETHLMRFPGGSSNLVSKRYDNQSKIMSRLTKLVTEKGWVYFDWNVDSDDAGSARDPETVFQNVTKNLSDFQNFVVLQHDIKEYSVDAVEKIIQFGQKNGFSFQKLDEKSFAAHHNVNN